MNRNDMLSTAKELLWEPAGLTENAILDVFGAVNANRVDWADAYFQLSRTESWALEEGIVKTGSFSIDRGFGLRAVSGEKQAFSYSDDVSLAALGDAAKTVRTIAAAGGSGICEAKSFKERFFEPICPAIDPLASLEAPAKTALLYRAEKLARSKDPRIKQVIAQLAGAYDVVLVAGSDGRLAADIRPIVRLAVTVIAESGDRRETGYAGAGARTDYGYFTDAVIESVVNEAVTTALTSLEAKPAPAGVMTVVLGSGWPGILLHEAVGHGLEADFNRKGSSAFSGRIGERVAAPGVTVVDDATLPGRRGSLSVDDEGNPGSNTVLIEDGILKGYLTDELNARLMGAPLTGNGRRESYSSLPIPRMTNTFMLAGTEDSGSIIASVEKGLYASTFGGGQVDITSGRFVFSATQAWLIENGKLTAPVTGATLIGSGPDVLHQVKMIGNDLNLDPGIGMCGKEGQSVPVGVGMPTVRIDGMTVGGTA